MVLRNRPGEYWLSPRGFRLAWGRTSPCRGPYHVGPVLSLVVELSPPVASILKFVLLSER